jgi:hypothetical protein
VGSSAIAAWIAHLTFWILLVYGWAWDEYGAKGIALFMFLWVAGLFALPLLAPNGAAMFASWVAVLDIALVFVIFKGDLRIS